MFLIRSVNTKDYLLRPVITNYLGSGMFTDSVILLLRYEGCPSKFAEIYLLRLCGKKSYQEPQYS